MSELPMQLRIDAAAGLVPDIVREDCRRAAARIEALEEALKEWIWQAGRNANKHPDWIKEHIAMYFKADGEAK